MAKRLLKEPLTLTELFLQFYSLRFHSVFSSIAVRRFALNVTSRYECFHPIYFRRSKNRFGRTQICSIVDWLKSTSKMVVALKCISYVRHHFILLRLLVEISFVFSANSSSIRSENINKRQRRSSLSLAVVSTGEGKEKGNAASEWKHLFVW